MRYNLDFSNSVKNWLPFFIEIIKMIIFKNIVVANNLLKLSKSKYFSELLDYVEYGYILLNCFWNHLYSVKLH